MNCSVMEVRREAVRYSSPNAIEFSRAFVDRHAT
jgi:hypothetical protein